MAFTTCSACGLPHYAEETACPHCAGKASRGRAALLLGVAFAGGCLFPEAQPAYGIETGWDTTGNAESSTTEDETPTIPGEEGGESSSESSSGAGTGTDTVGGTSTGTGGGTDTDADTGTGTGTDTDTGTGGIG